MRPKGRQILPGMEPIGRNALQQVPDSAKVADHKEAERHNRNQHNGEMKELRVDGGPEAPKPDVKQNQGRRQQDALKKAPTQKSNEHLRGRAETDFRKAAAS